MKAKMKKHLIFLLVMIIAISTVYTALADLTVVYDKAIKRAELLLKYSAYSKSGLIKQLESEGFTSEEAKYAVDYHDTDWYDQAVKRTGNYLHYSALSYKGLIKQLESEGFTSEEAKYAADNCNADWYDQAVKRTGNHLQYSVFSYKGLIKQLEFEGFTSEEAKYAADNCNADWYDQAVKKAENRLQYSAYSKSGLIKQLESERFTSEEAKYAADNCSADWYDQAVKKAENHLQYSAYSKSGLIKQLESEGFTSEEAKYAADNCNADWYDQAVKEAKYHLQYSAYSKSELIKKLDFDGFTSEEAEYGVALAFGENPMKPSTANTNTLSTTDEPQPTPKDNTTPLPVQKTTATDSNPQNNELDVWICGNCGNNATGNFCSNCGTARVWTCPVCNNNATGNFCNNCGTARLNNNILSSTSTSAPTSAETPGPTSTSVPTPAETPSPTTTPSELLERQNVTAETVPDPSSVSDDSELITNLDQVANETGFLSALPVRYSMGILSVYALKQDGTIWHLSKGEMVQSKLWNKYNIIKLFADSHGSGVYGLDAEGKVHWEGASIPEIYWDFAYWTNIKLIAICSDSHAVALTNDGTWLSAGDYRNGECDVEEWTDIVDLAAGENFTVGLKSDGTVVATGKNNYGQCNVDGWKDIVSIAVSESHTVGLTSKGKVLAVGRDKDDECFVGRWTDVARIYACNGYTVGITKDGSILCTNKKSHFAFSKQNHSDAITIPSNFLSPNAISIASYDEFLLSVVDERGYVHTWGTDLFDNQLFPVGTPKNEYTLSECQSRAVDYLKAHLKNPASYQEHSISYFLKDGTYTFTIDYSAMNGFGGYNRSIFVCSVDIKTGKVTTAISN